MCVFFEDNFYSEVRIGLCVDLCKSKLSQSGLTNSRVINTNNIGIPFFCVSIDETLF